jgi:hypothetical protein
LQQSDDLTSGAQTLTIVAEVCASAGISKETIYVCDAGSRRWWRRWNSPIGRVR